MSTVDCKVINTAGLLAACAWADKTQQNRRADTEALTEVLDPEGAHLLARELAFHNEQPVDRVMVYAKVIGSMDPVQFWLDVPHDLYEQLIDAEDIRKVHDA